ncbi:MAG: glycosyltransferase family 39 protein [Pirellulales bacterium]|nr:glycosyltransferase family 39 protein [Pirellulales bacterium]
MSAAAAAKPPSAPIGRERSLLRAYRGPIVVALLALFATALTLSPSGYGPGVTCDEYYDALAGKRLVQSFLRHGVGFFTAPVIHETFDWQTKHPPLGRWLLGWVHAFGDPLPGEPNAVWLPVARLASAIEFAAMILVVGWLATRWAGALAGTLASFSLATMPRCFGHAHFATLDTPTAMFFTLALAGLAWAAETSGTARRAALAGVLAGLAMATKLHGLLLAPVALLVFVCLKRRHGLPAFAAWSLAAAAVFFVSWPWLWLAPWDHLRQFLGTATQRQSLHVFYLDRSWNDFEAPWHYPAVMFAVCQPPGWLLLGCVGLIVGLRKHRGAVACSAASGLLVVLGVFSWPGVPVYDGVRLFLMAFPLWSVFVGAGSAAVIDRFPWERWRLPWRVVFVAVLAATQATGLIALHPFQLSYYNLLIGGLQGAERLGFETTYWGDTIQGELLTIAAAQASGETIIYAPHLAPFQAETVEATSPELAATTAHLAGWDSSQADPLRTARWLLVYRRRADLAEIERRLAGAAVVAEISRQGVWLARLYRLNPSAEPPPAAQTSASQSP